jgi:hypothetical protein
MVTNRSRKVARQPYYRCVAKPVTAGPLAGVAGNRLFGVLAMTHTSPTAF